MDVARLADVHPPRQPSGQNADQGEGQVRANQAVIDGSSCAVVPALEALEKLVRLRRTMMHLGSLVYASCGTCVTTNNGASVLCVDCGLDTVLYYVVMQRDSASWTDPRVRL